MRLSTIFFTLILLTFGGAFQVDAKEHEEDETHLGFFDWLEQEHVEVTGSIEAEHVTAGVYNSNAKQTESTISYDFRLHVEPKPWIGGAFEISTEYEKPVKIDEAWMILGNPEHFPLYFTVGKMTLPFGLYESAMLTDSLTLELGETTADMLLLGMDWEGLYLKGYGFESLFQQSDEQAALKSFGADIGYLWEEDDFAIQIGASWIRDMSDSDGLSDYIKEEEFVPANRVPGFATYASLNWGAITFAAEQITGDKQPRYLNDDLLEIHAKPKAWTTEIIMAGKLAGIELESGLMYGESEGTLDILPRKRMGGALTVYPLEHLRLSIEYLREDDHSILTGGTDAHANIFTFQLALEL